MDFCIGKSIKIEINSGENFTTVIPVIAVEVKTYLDATMFREVKSASKSICSAVPGARTYILTGYKSLADEHIIAARQESDVAEIFVLKKNADSEIDYKTIFAYYNEIVRVVTEITENCKISVPGKILHP